MSMKWKKLGDFNPPFETKLIIGFKDGNWTCAYLETIEEKADGTIYHFKDGENEYNNATHYFVPSATPKTA